MPASVGLKSCYIVTLLHPTVKGLISQSNVKCVDILRGKSLVLHSICR
jgi:hypothetical protein